jgi:hypothetical protein
METTTLYALKFKGSLIELDEEKVQDFQPALVETFEFRHEPYTADRAIAVGQKLVRANLLNAQGIGDPEALAVARGKFIAEEIVKGWNRTMGDGQELPITPETIGAQPRLALRMFGVRIETGVYPTVEEIEAMKNPKNPTPDATLDSSGSIIKTEV